MSGRYSEKIWKADIAAAADVQLPSLSPGPRQRWMMGMMLKMKLEDGGRLGGVAGL